MPLQQVEPVKIAKPETKTGKIIRWAIGIIAVAGLIAIFVSMWLNN